MSDTDPNNSEEEENVENKDPQNGSDQEEAKELTPEEQMALYEESLKEDDWGHQPC